MFVADPVWLADSFKNQLTDPDVGALDRNLIVADFLSALLPRMNLEDETVVDWGSGYGLLSRLMRDRGFNFMNFEEHVRPLFYAPSFDPGQVRASMAVLSEVALHFDDPVGEFERLSRISSQILFTAVVPPSRIDENWWYLMPSTGQHVAFYSIDALRQLAENLKVNLTTDGKFFHLLHREPIPLPAKLMFSSRVLPFSLARLGQLVRDVKRALGRSHSLLQLDQNTILLKSREDQ